jgi:hypothetical protein
LGDVLVWSEVENVSVLGQKAYSKALSTVGLDVGEYVFEVVYSYTGGQTASSFKSFRVKNKSQESELPLGLIITIVMIFIIAAIIIFLFKTGRIYIERK